MFRVTLALTVILPSAPPILAQELVYTFEGDSSGDLLGSSVCSPGDLDGDGLPDLLIAAPGDSTRKVRAFSGRDGAFLFGLNGAAEDRYARWIAATGDVDGDQVGDFVVSAPLGRYGHVHSGATKALLYEISYTGGSYFNGGQVAGIGDANGDGVGDIGVGLRYGVNGSVCVHSGVDGALLWCRDENHIYSYGNAVEAVGDANGDGRADVLVGAPHAFNDRRGLVQILSGVDGSEIRSFIGDGVYHHLGSAVSGVGDVDGDGLDDVVALASTEVGLTPDAAYVRIYSGGSGAILLHVSIGEEPFDAALEGVGDLDGDDVPDFLLSGDLSGPNVSVLLYSGDDGALLWSSVPGGAGDHALAATGDVNGDGTPDFVLGGPDTDPNGSSSGQAFVHALLGAPLPESYCTGAPNSVGAGAVMDWEGTASVTHNDLVLGARACPPQQPGLFFYGPETAQLPFGDGIRCVGPGTLGTFRLNPPASTDASGSIERALDLDAPPADGGPGEIDAGSTWHFQFWYRDPSFGTAGFNLSDGLRVQFYP